MPLNYTLSYDIFIINYLIAGREMQSIPYNKREVKACYK